MKTTAVIFIVLLSFVEIRAQDQIKQGVYSLGGSIGYSSNSSGQSSFTSDMTEFYFAPSGSYFIVDQLELSFGVGYSYQFASYSDSPDNKWTILSLEFGSRYYFPCGKVAPFIGANGSLGWTSINGSSYLTQTNYSFTGGVEVFISQAAAIEPTINYNSYHYNDQTSSHGIQIGLGVKYFIL